VYIPKSSETSVAVGLYKLRAQIYFVLLGFDVFASGDVDGGRMRRCVTVKQYNVIEHMD
jgi:hypothetical protein